MLFRYSFGGKISILHRFLEQETKDDMGMGICNGWKIPSNFQGMTRWE
jgi:hypothetical protein